MILVNGPVYVRVERYHSALDRYVERAKRVRGVRTIATMGSVTALGLSDIDVIVITEDMPGDKSLAGLSTKGIDENLFLHGAVVVPISFLPYLQWIVYASRPNVVYGTDALPPSDDLALNERNILAMCYLIDFSESRFLQFSLARKTAKLDLRHWHTRIWSVSHSVNLWTNVLNKKLTHYEMDLLQSVHLLRSLWKEGRYVGNEVFMEAFFAAEKLNISIFTRSLHAFYKNLGEKPRQIVTGPKKFCFVDPTSQPQYQVRSIAIGGRRISCWACKVPSLYYKHISNYLEVLGYDIEVAEDRDERVHGIAKTRASIVVKHWDWLMKRAYSAGSMSGYLGVHRKRSSRGLNNHLLALVRKALLVG